MKPLLILLLSGFAYTTCLAQTPQEKKLLFLSDRIFQWEVAGKIDALEQVFHPQFQVVGSGGEAQAKAAYMTRLRSGSFVHHAIDVQESKAMVSGNTGTVFGKGTFKVTINGQPLTLRLSYMEVFTRPDQYHPWKVLAMHASTLPETHP